MKSPDLVGCYQAPHRTAADARSAARKSGLEPYRCDVCGTYHLRSVRRAKEIAARRKRG